ncbi:hypothetical protein B0H13DRAFT_2310672 [Mycena leptocephala]|nr:hypothetical protein B0H13DRAFT_2310672 [Mycena leptocephala]
MSNPDFYAVYSDVEAEFYAWKSEYVADLFSQLFNPSDSPTPAIQTFRLSSLISEQHQHQNTVKDCIYICDYDTDGKSIKSECVPLTVVRADNFLPHLPYQFCTPSSRSITASMINNKSAPFIPYPDDPTFPQECYLSSFDSFQWIYDQRDPDEEVIQYETIRRLHIDHGLSAKTINDMIDENPGFRPLRLSSASGLVWDVSQRDLPPVIWGDGLPSSSKRQLPPHFAQEFPQAYDIFDQINHGIAKFCPSLNCITDNCQIHVDSQYELYTPPLNPKEPQLTSADFFEQPGDACGGECFRGIDSDDMEVDVFIDLKFLDSMLKLDPDLLPCDLAVICKLPCEQIFLYRRQLLPDDEILENRYQLEVTECNIEPTDFWTRMSTSHLKSGADVPLDVKIWTSNGESTKSNLPSTVSEHLQHNIFAKAVLLENILVNWWNLKVFNTMWKFTTTLV